jgi:DNA-binding transcriptional regulator YiaG
MNSIQQYTSPSNMPDTEVMTDAEFRCVREWLGVTGDWLADHLGVTGRSVRRWEAGTAPVPDGVRVELEQLEAQTGEAVDRLVATLRDARDPEVVVYRTDEEIRAADPGSPWPAEWWRRVAMRAVLEVDGVAIRYAE